MIVLENVSMSQGDFSLKNVSFQIPQGAYAVLMGPSGCGKTTIIEIICGLRAIDQGSIRVGNRDVTVLPPAQREIAYVPQDRALFPGHLVREQIAFALIIRRWSQERIHERVNELANLLGIEHLLDRLPDGLSGGETQRVSLGRALAASPRVLCLDEPLSALDEDKREDMYNLLKLIHEKTAVTVCHITHSSAEAKRLGTCVLQMQGVGPQKEPQVRIGNYRDGIWAPTSE